jgi:hypothetical protein
MTLAYPISLPITLLILVIAGAALLYRFRPAEKTMWGCGVLLAVGLFLAFRFATWSAVIDERGVHVTAPLDIFRSAGTLSWDDIIMVDLKHRRRSGDTLRLLGRYRGALELPVGEMTQAEAEADIVTAEIIRRLPGRIRDPGLARRVHDRLGFSPFHPALVRLKTP